MNDSNTAEVYNKSLWRSFVASNRIKPNHSHTPTHTQENHSRLSSIFIVLRLSNWIPNLNQIGVGVIVNTQDDSLSLIAASIERVL